MKRSVFTTPLDTRAVDGGYKLLAPLVYYSEILDDIIVAPIGFVTNFASVPAPFRVFISGHGEDRWAATIHDYLYGSAKYPRELADRLFLEAMKATGVNLFKRRLMYRAVRTGGWLFYAKD
jgi:hypothetical protein